MSELVNARETRMSFRWQLLATVSAMALLACSYGAGEARAADNDSDRPTVWIELGGQLSALQDSQETFSPPLMSVRPSIFGPSQTYEKPPRLSIDEAAKLSFQPENSDWMFSASIRYGRSSSKRHISQQTNPVPFQKYYYSSLISARYLHGTRHRVTGHAYPSAVRFADTSAMNSERHAILDFQAGKDVGLGLFGGRDGSSVVSLGVRFAQFRGNSNIALKSDPDWHFHYKYLPSVVSINRPSSKFAIGQIYHSNSASLQVSRTFHGIGPSLSWNASAPFAGNLPDGELTIDWGLNAALLFGRQRAKVHHQATGQYHGSKYGAGTPRVIVYQPTPVNKTRSRNVTVPNVGGSIGLSWQLQNFKMSFGYRADMFFGAMDGGIDAAKKENVGFYGPFASVSVGIGG
jgi:iron complex outermembrane recepter protein